MKDIPGYRGLYAITSCGRVWSYKNKRFLKSYKDSDDYLMVGLFKNGNKKSFKVHRLVAQSFIPNPNNYPQINHKDENKSNNYVKNLEWCTCEYNNNYGSHNEKIRKKSIGNKNRSKKCKCIETNKIYDSTKAAALELNCHENSVSRVCRGVRKFDIWFPFHLHLKINKF